MVPENNPQNGSQPNEQPAVNIGNASNPSSRPDDLEPMSDNQLLSEGAEKYLREVASIEDYPDARDDEEMDQEIKKDQ
jgi:hypothetical protein